MVMRSKVRLVQHVAAPNGGGYVKGPNPYFVSFMGDAPKKNPKVIVWYELGTKNDQEAYELGVSKAFKTNNGKYFEIFKCR